MGPRMPDRVAEIRTRLDGGASDGIHWRVSEDTDYSYRRAVVVPSPDSAPDEPFNDFIAKGIRDDETADLIANAPADIEWLLTEVNIMRVVIASMRAEVRELEARIGIAIAHGNDDPAGRAYQDRGAP